MDEGKEVGEGDLPPWLSNYTGNDLNEYQFLYLEEDRAIQFSFKPFQVSVN